MRRKLGGRSRVAACALLIAAWTSGARSEVTLDGSLGGARGPLPGPDFEIGADFGRQIGSNLFHSFGAFNLDARESATFSGPNTINNVLGRVTGGSGSSINGLLRSTIPDANLFLLNPAGIVFGPSASLNVQGSFHASTGDFIRLADGTRFDAVPSAKDALLTTKPPQAFGFLDGQAASISFQGSPLTVPEGETLSVIGGDIEITQAARLRAPSGRVNMASVASAGEVRLKPKGVGVGSFNRLGKMDMAHGSTIDVSEADGSVTGGGSVFIRSGQLVMDNSHVVANTKNGNSQGIDIGLTDDLMMTQSRIEAATFGGGHGGDVQVEAENMVLGGAFRRELDGELIAAQTGVFTSSEVDPEDPEDRTDPAGGDAGNVTVKVGRLQMRPGSRISAITISRGKGGDLTIEANEIVLSRQAGLSVRNSGRTHGGESRPGDRGDAGNITVKAGRLEIRDGGAIGATTEQGPGKAGNLDIEAQEIVLFDATISASTEDTGDGGNITIRADRLQLGGESQIRARSGEKEEHPNATGRSGRIFIEVRNTFRLFDDSLVNVETQRANAGDITLHVGTLLHLRDRSGITTSVAGGRGNGGNILLIEPVFTVLDGDSRIVARAREGIGGNISIMSDFFFGPLQNVSASSDRGIAGMVEIDSPETDLNAGLLPLPANFFDAAEVLLRPCAERSGADVIRLVVRPYEVLPDSPYALRVQRPKAPPGANSGRRGEHGMATPAPLALGCLDGA